jgi:hypothetical protein
VETRSRGRGWLRQPAILGRASDLQPLQDHRLRRRRSPDDRQILVEPEFERTDRRVGLEVRLVLLAPTVFIGEIRPSHCNAGPRKSEGDRAAGEIAAGRVDDALRVLRTPKSLGAPI